MYGNTLSTSRREKNGDNRFININRNAGMAKMIFGIVIIPDANKTPDKRSFLLVHFLLKRTIYKGMR